MLPEVAHDRAPLPSPLDAATLARVKRRSLLAAVLVVASLACARVVDEEPKVVAQVSTTAVPACRELRPRGRVDSALHDVAEALTLSRASRVAIASMVPGLVARAIW